MSKVVIQYGPMRGGVRVLDTGSRLVVKWPPRKQRTYPRSKDGRRDALEFARGLHDGTSEKAARVEGLTVGALWAAYATAAFPSLRPRSRERMAQRWRGFEVFAGHGRLAESLEMIDLDKYRAALEKLNPPKAPNQIKLAIQTVKLVFRWARGRRMVQTSLPDYRLKMGLDQRANEPDEYIAGDFEALLGALDPRKANEWRPWALLMLLGHQGVRVNAALHLRWEDVGEGRLNWTAAYDKMGRDWDQPMRDGALSAILTAQWWREREAYEGGWVFFSARLERRERLDQPYGVQALWRALQGAEERSGVRHRPLRALHGLRRMVAGDVLEETGDPKAAMDFIGDQDFRLMQKYLKKRDRRREDVARRMDGARAGGGN